jgi:hypothetical protein
MGNTQKLGNLINGLTVDANGNVGINTSAPAYRLDVTGTGRFTGNLSVTSTYGFSIGDVTSVARIQHNAGTFFLLNSGNGYATLNAGQFNFSVPANTSYGNYDAVTNGYAFSVYKYSGTIYGYLGQHSAFTGGASSTDLAIVSTNNLIFGTSNSFTERMRITSGGDVGIGTSSPTYRLQVNGGSGTYLIGGQSDSSGFAIIIQNSSNNNLILARNDGLISFPKTASTWTTGNAANAWINPSGGDLYRSTSSIKYKKNVQDYTKGLAEVMQLRPVSYEGKGNIDADKTFAGLIAEEVQELGLTEFVQYAEDGTPDALAYQNMVALLTKAIQEQQAIIESQEQRIAYLENK